MTQKVLLHWSPILRRDIQHDDTQYNDIQQNVTQHKGIIGNTQHGTQH
jgi:hypothetical protein